MSERNVPHNVEAEESLLGAMLLSKAARRDGLAACTRDSFYVPKHREVFGAMAELWADGKPVDLVTVAEVLRRHGKLDMVGGSTFLMQLQGNVPASANAVEYARIVADLATLRRMIEFAGDLADAAYKLDDDLVTRLLDNMAERTEVTTVPVDVGDDVLDLAEREYEHDWLVENLLERGDRVMISGPEGWGKSTLLRQLGLMMACGIHPFRRLRIPPLKVVVVDCENSDAQNTRAYRWLLKKCAGLYEPGRMIVVNRRQGMNLRNAGDARWLDGALAYHAPDLLVIGPLYKMFEGSPGIRKDSEEAADEVARVIDQLRVKHDCAVFIEAHAPHGDQGDRAGWRPFGASLWMRWPEFGLGLKPSQNETVQLVHWRGARDRNRDWPDRLYEGPWWPWQAEQTWVPEQDDPTLGV